MSETDETIDFLNQVDTQGPGEGEEEETEDTGSPEAEEEGDTDEDTGAPRINLKAAGSIMGRIGLLKKRNQGRPLSDTQIKGLVLQQRAKAASTAKKTAIRRIGPQFRLPALPGFAPTPPRVQQFRNDMFSDYRKKHRGAVEQRGFYYSTFEVKLSADGTANAATCSLFLDPGANGVARFPAFDKAIDDTAARGNIAAYKWTRGDTNLLYPGRNVYPDELMVIEYVKIEPIGYMVDYTAAVIDPLTLTDRQKAVLKGQHVFFDDAGVFIPKDLFNEYTGESLVTRAIFNSAVLCFAWTKNQGGGTSGTEEVVIKPLAEVLSRTGLAETSGGAVHLTMDDGYIWSLNLQDSARNGLFEARMNLYNSVTLPVNAVKIPAGAVNPIAPVSLTVLYRITVYGDTIRPKDSTPDVPQRRR